MSRIVNAIKDIENIKAVKAEEEIKAEAAVKK